MMRFELFEVFVEFSSFIFPMQLIICQDFSSDCNNLPTNCNVFQIIPLKNQPLQFDHKIKNYEINPFSLM